MTGDELRPLVLMLEQKVWDAVVAKNGKALSELFDDGYIEITVDGKRIEKSEIVEMSPQIDEINGYVMDSERVVFLGANTAVLNYHLTLDGKCGGTTILPRERWVTSIWSQIAGRWLCRFFQQSPFRQEDADNR